MTGKYAKLLLFFGVLFVLSVSFMAAGLRGWPVGGVGGDNGFEIPNVDPEDILKPEEGTLNLSMVLAVVTAVASGGGFLATTYFALRNDRRQAAIHRLQIHSLVKEIEHKDLEIKQLRRELAKKPSP